VPKVEELFHFNKKMECSDTLTLVT